MWRSGSTRSRTSATGCRELTRIPHREDAIMPTITHNGVKLAYESRGTGRPAFVFVHGWTCDRSFFAPQAKHFARRHRVVSLDLRGHGESEAPGRSEDHTSELQ